MDISNNPTNYDAGFNTNAGVAGSTIELEPGVWYDSLTWDDNAVRDDDAVWGEGEAI